MYLIKQSYLIQEVYGDCFGKIFIGSSLQGETTASPDLSGKQSFLYDILHKRLLRRLAMTKKLLIISSSVLQEIEAQVKSNYDMINYIGYKTIIIAKYLKTFL